MTDKNETVLLLHGYGRTPRSMYPVERFLCERGYAVHNIEYASRRGTVEQLAIEAIEPAVQKLSGQRVHFVTHSMGGILVRWYLSQRQVDQLGRVVQIAPPNHGSLWADVLTRVPLSQSLNGPGLSQLQKPPHGITDSLPKPHYDLGVITARFDEKVPRASTAVEGMTDQLIVSAMHTLVMNKKKTLEGIHSFLQDGRF